jgi:hypothetical protein
MSSPEMRTRPGTNPTETITKMTALGASGKPAVSSGFCEADEGTRTLDLLHGKDTARGDRNCQEQTDCL